MYSALSNTKLATFAGGCFWCTEAVFAKLKGVTSVTSGYIGGSVENPTYDQVCSGTTGHAEAIQIEFDPSEISYLTLLEIFFATHDPTTLNRQGADVGTQYRSAVFYHNQDQKNEVEKYIASVDSSKKYTQPIVTEIAPATTFYPAEEYHQAFYQNNPNYGYCRLVIDPKISKLLREFRGKVDEVEL